MGKVQAEEGPHSEPYMAMNHGSSTEMSKSSGWPIIFLFFKFLTFSFIQCPLQCNYRELDMYNNLYMKLVTHVMTTVAVGLMMRDK